MNRTASLAAAALAAIAAALAACGTVNTTSTRTGPSTRACATLGRWAASASSST